MNYMLPFSAPRNQLAFPVGRAPGFDPMHIAAAGMSSGNALSAVTTVNRGMVNLLTGKPLTIVGSPNTQVISPLGPSSLINTSGQEYTASILSSTPTAVTEAAIIMLVAYNASGYQFIVAGNNNSAMLYATEGINNQHVGIFLGGTNFTTFASQLNVPYFVACSVAPSKQIAFVIVNLLNGSLFTQTITGVNLPAGNGGTIAVANDPGSTADILNGYVAAAMYSTNYVSSNALRAWAADPWAFWYPRRKFVGGF